MNDLLRDCPNCGHPITMHRDGGGCPMCTVFPCPIGYIHLEPAAVEEPPTDRLCPACDHLVDLHSEHGCGFSTWLGLAFPPACACTARRSVLETPESLRPRSTDPKPLLERLADRFLPSGFQLSWDSRPLLLSDADMAAVDAELDAEWPAYDAAIREQSERDIARLLEVPVSVETRASMRWAFDPASVAATAEATSVQGWIDFEIEKHQRQVNDIVEDYALRMLFGNRGALHGILVVSRMLQLRIVTDVLYSEKLVPQTITWLNLAEHEPIPDTIWAD